MILTGTQAILRCMHAIPSPAAALLLALGAAHCGGAVVSSGRAADSGPAEALADGADARAMAHSGLDAGVPSRDVPDGADALTIGDSGSTGDADGPDKGELDGEDVAAETATHGCTDDRFVDRSAGTDGGRTIVVAPGNRYDPPCLAIRVGQTVTFTGAFSAHPLAPGVAPRRSGAGATPSPIEMRSEGTVYRVQFPTPGNYPYYCVYHAGGGMYGVIRVSP
jgi:plastocyanin